MLFRLSLGLVVALSASMLLAQGPQKNDSLPEKKPAESAAPETKPAEPKQVEPKISDPAALEPGKKKSRKEDPATKPDSKDESKGESKGETKAENRKAAKAANATPNEEQALAFAREHHAELAGLLEALKNTNRKEYDRGIQELFRTTERLSRFKDKSSSHYQFELKTWQLESKIRLVQARLTMTEDPVLEAEIRELLKQRSALKLAHLREERIRVEKMLQQIDTRLAAAEQSLSQEALDAEMVKIRNNVTANRERKKNKKAAAKKPDAVKSADPGKQPGSRKQKGPEKRVGKNAFLGKKSGSGKKSSPGKQAVNDDKPGKPLKS